LNWKTINVEPLSTWYNELVVNRPKSINIQRDLHPTENNTTIEFNIPILGGHGIKNHLGSINKQIYDTQFVNNIVNRNSNGANIDNINNLN
jgi:hypothetical protein